MLWLLNTECWIQYHFIANIIWWHKFAQLKVSYRLIGAQNTWRHFAIRFNAHCRFCTFVSVIAIEASRFCFDSESAMSKVGQTNAWSESKKMKYAKQTVLIRETWTHWTDSKANFEYKFQLIEWMDNQFSIFPLISQISLNWRISINDCIRKIISYMYTVDQGLLINGPIFMNCFNSWIECQPAKISSKRRLNVG